MGKDPKDRAEILERVAALGGLTDGVAREVSVETGVPEAEVFGAASFFHLLNDPNTKVRVCTGLACQLRGASKVLAAAEAAGWPVREVSCLAACDRPPAVMRERDVFVDVDVSDITGDWKHMSSAAEPSLDWTGAVGPAPDDDTQAMNLLGEPRFDGARLALARELGPDEVIARVDGSGLQGRGGAGFPAAFKWKAVRQQAETTRYVVLNADEGEPGTFKDREVMLRRPDLVIEGLAIAAASVGAKEVWCYLRGEFGAPWRAMEDAIERLQPHLGDIHFHLHAGHGAYICGEETALLEALEGKRGMPRLKPPFPTENGLWGKPTLMHNVETIACVPWIVERGGDAFRALGKTEPGSKLYCVSGHVKEPGVYELPLGVTLDELVEAAGGYDGELLAFSPGGASSGFLPASERERPLDFKSLAEAGSMLGSAGLVVLNTESDLSFAVREQLRFFEVESCGQCAPCRIGTRFLREAVDRKRAGGEARLAEVAEAAWEMNEGSICGLGQAAPLPLTTVLKRFPEVFEE